MEVPMCPVKSISAEHKDLIHDVAFDFYGKRMATCSSDQSVKVWDLGDNGEWQCTANWRTHGGSVWRVTWGHPEFGQVLASCSFDRTTIIWEEIVGDSNSKQKIQGHWVKRTTFVDSRTSVTDVKFAPKHLGLQVATCSADGIVRFYEAPDVMNLTVWSSVEEEINTKMAKCSCISWNPSRHYQLDTLLASLYDAALVPNILESSDNCSVVHPPMVAVGSNNPNPSGGGKVLLFEYSQAERKWNKVETLMNITEAVHDVAFAPNLGRSYHTLAVASKDVKITTLKPLRSEHTGTMAGPTRLEVCQSGLLEHQNRQVWRISWNITGTILASSSDDGFVRLWKANYLENWKCIQTLKGDGQYIKPFGTASNQMLEREQEESTRSTRGWLL